MAVDNRDIHALLVQFGEAKTAFSLLIEIYERQEQLIKKIAEDNLKLTIIDRPLKQVTVVQRRRPRKKTKYYTIIKAICDIIEASPEGKMTTVQILDEIDRAMPAVSKLIFGVNRVHVLSSYISREHFMADAVFKRDYTTGFVSMYRPYDLAYGA